MAKSHQPRDPRTTKPHHLDAPFISPQYDGVLIVDDIEDDVAEVLRDSDVIHSIRDARRTQQW